jgi:peptide subunit release factor 1 (eRF1)
MDPSDEESDDQTVPGTKRRAGRSSKKQDRLRQKEREHKAVRFYTTRSNAC